MAVDPQVQPLLDMMAAAGASPIETQTPAAMRQLMGQNPLFAGPKPEVASVENRMIPGPNGDIPVRIYRPDAGGPLPMLVWYHGGGWVVGDLEFADGTCR